MCSLRLASAPKVQRFRWRTDERVQTAAGGILELMCDRHPHCGDLMVCYRGTLADIEAAGLLQPRVGRSGLPNRARDGGRMVIRRRMADGRLFIRCSREPSEAQWMPGVSAWLARQPARSTDTRSQQLLSRPPAKWVAGNRTRIDGYMGIVRDLVADATSGSSSSTLEEGWQADADDVRRYQQRAEEVRDELKELLGAIRFRSSKRSHLRLVVDNTREARRPAGIDGDDDPEIPRESP